MLDVVPSIFAGCTASLSTEDEELFRERYRRGASCMWTDSQAARTDLALASEVNPWVAEPPLLLGWLHLDAGCEAKARQCFENALRLFVAWGTAWDKRLSWNEWISLGHTGYKSCQERLGRVGFDRTDMANPPPSG